MKKYLAVLILLFASSFAYSQKNDTCDYFSVGVYGGSYFASLPINAANNFISEITLELEYRKTKDLSFFISGLYVFAGNDLKKMYPELNYPWYTTEKNPEAYRLLFTIGGRYNLRPGNLNPYLQMGLAEEFTYVGDYSYYEAGLNGGLTNWTNRGYHNSRLEIMAGAGLNIKLFKNLHLDLQYSMNKLLGGEYKEFLNHVVNGGLKYNIF